ncbi:Gfo/Idh/MocA family oxidoreductase [Bacteroidia bacterium]|nr:Gfo/Idh/MocA family oxidoreductase [Bacteroidia bacterium]
MSKIKFAVIGCGHIGKRHASMVQLNGECELVAICDTASLDSLELENITAVFYSSAKEMLEKEGAFLDVVCICTPNGSHFRLADLCLDFNTHVLIEKPMALTQKSCQDLIDKSVSVNKNVFCVMQNRYSPPAKWLKEIVHTGVLGDIYNVQVNCYWNRDDRYYFKDGEKHPWKGTNDLDGGTLFTQFSHFVDLMYWIFGDIENIQAKFNNFSHKHSIEFEDSGLVSFNFVNGGMGCLNYSTAVLDTNLESSITVIAEKGTVKVGGQYMNEVEICNVKDYSFIELPASNPANDYGHYKGSANNHPYVFENVVDVIKGRKPITTNALEGLKVVELIERIYACKK